MSSPFWHGLSDEQLAEMMILHGRVEKLTALLNNSTRLTASTIVDRDQIAREAASAVVEAQSGWTDERRKHADTKQALQRSNATAVVLLRALNDLVDVMNSPAVLVHQSEWPGEVFRALTGAEEVLALNDIPF